MKYLLFILSLGFVISASYSQGNNNIQSLVFKVKPEYRKNCFRTRISNEEFEKAVSRLGNAKIIQKFPQGNLVKNPANDISLIYGIEYEGVLPPDKICRILLGSGILAYAEVAPNPKGSYFPNDPEIATQYALSLIKAFDGWDIEKGDTSMVIGIVDSGVEWDHPDLKGNISYNWADPIDGIDNDGDGYTDNFRGWDLYYQDNDPMTSGNDHGTWVAGLCSAETDNQIGIAGVGFKCKFLPVRVSGDGSNNMTLGYEGIVYAADHNCKIINCSWAGVNAGGGYAQDIINYATFERNALVIAAAGNEGKDQINYPAGFENVISCAATNQNDIKPNFSNWGIGINLCAPGIAVQTTDAGGTYSGNGMSGFFGTSFATPIIAGCAALVRSRYPELSPEQTAELLRRSADNVDSLPDNLEYAGLLGGGRVNLARAISEAGLQSVRYRNRLITNLYNNYYLPGDTIILKGDLVNFLTPVSKLKVSLSTLSPNVEIITGESTIGDLGTMDTFHLSGNELKFTILPNTPRGENIRLKIIYSGTGYQDFEWFEVRINSGYLNVNINRLKTSFGSAGRTGFNQDFNLDGQGYLFEGRQIVYSSGIGLMIGGNPVRVSDAFYDKINTSEDFTPVQFIQTDSSAGFSDNDLIARFNDHSISGTLNLDVTLKTHGWADPGFDNFHILEYVVRHTGNINIPPVYIGLGADWDMNSTLKGNTDLTNKLGFVWATAADSLYAGISLITDGAPFTHYAIDYVDINQYGGINIFDNFGFSTSEKYLALRTNRLEGGTLKEEGNGIVSVVGSGPYFLMAGDSVIVAFAVIAGHSLEELQTGAERARERYQFTVSASDHRPGSIQVSLFPNPGHYPEMAIQTDNSDEFILSLTNSWGQEVWRKSLFMPAGPQTLSFPELAKLPAGLYFFTLQNESGRRLAKKWIKN